MMPKILGQLQSATFEILASDPSGSVAGRFWLNTTEDRVKTDNGTNKRALLRNDQFAVIGNNGTANNNVRLHRGAASLLQFVLGGDATAEGTLSTSLGQISARVENYLNAGLPANGNAGRIAFVTDTLLFKGDNGASWVTLGPNPTTTKGDLIVHNGTLDVRLPVGTDGFFLKANSSTSEGVEWASGAANLTIRTIVATGSALTTDDWILVDASGGAVTVNLFAIAGNAGKVLRIRKTDTTTNLVTIDASGAETINGALTQTLYVENEEMTIVVTTSGWKITQYLPRLPSTQTASASATIDISVSEAGSTGMVEIELVNIVPSNDGASFYCLVSTDGGGTFHTAASDYDWTSGGADGNAGATGDGDSVDPQIVLDGNVPSSNMAGSAACATVKVYTPGNTSVYKHIMWNYSWENSAGDQSRCFIGSGRYVGALSAITHIRFLFSAGTIASGTFIKKIKTVNTQ
jgi:hypothetical protein